MILRKPYAFLIKHFKMIHIILFLLGCFVLYQTNGLYSMIEEYQQLMIYNETVNSVLTYVSTPTILALVAIIIISGVLIYLLYYKKKPVIFYFLEIAEYGFTLTIMLLTKNYFDTASTLGDVAQIRALHDFTLITMVLQYIFLFFLLIRSIGLDLKKFGFNEDREFIAEAGDDEEVELDVEFDYHATLRFIKGKLRELKYFYGEHRKLINVLLIAFIAFGLWQGYTYVFVTNRVYAQNEYFKANSYRFKVNNVYFTDKDYAGNLISTTNKYIIVSLDIENVTSKSPITFDYERWSLVTDRNRYVPSTSKSDEFRDLGTTYKNDLLEYQKVYTFLLIYEIKNEDLGSNYTLYYEEVQNANSVYDRKVKINPIDLTNYQETDTKYIGEEMTVPFYDDTQAIFNLTAYQLVDQSGYYYEGCASAKECGVYYRELLASSFAGSNKIMYIPYTSNYSTGLLFSNFITRQGKLVYKVGDTTKTTTIKSAVTRNYRGNFLYLVVPAELENATEIEFQFVVRDKLYHYVLKSEGKESEIDESTT